MKIEHIPTIFSDNNSIDPETDFHYEFIQKMPTYLSFHNHDFFEVVLVTKGKMNHLIKQEIQLLHEGMLLLIRPEDYHYYEKVDENPCNFINLAFSAEIFRSLISYLGENIDIDYFLGPHMPLTTLLTKKHTEFLRERIDKLNTYFNKVEIKAEFRAIMADILTCLLHRQFIDVKKNYPSWMNVFLTNLHKKEYFTKDISQLYKTVHKSRAHISRVFKNNIGKTPTEYLNEIRLNYAARSLIHSNNPVLDIAFESGFENLSHFYHLFKKKYGVPPNKYRKVYQQILIQ
ncbi:MAG: AraC family transcriptional regulator [Spirochaetia bacterium]|nr:AraC family transcriptional regulator [Spirochaetia bacterium]